MAIQDRYGGAWTRGELEELAADYARANGVPGDGLIALIGQESAWNPEAQSPAGAQGLAQFMPATAAEWEIDPWDPVEALSGAAKYLKWLRTKTGSWSASLAAYNWGIGNVTRATDAAGQLELDALPPETRAYVLKLAPAFGERIDEDPKAPIMAGIGPVLVVLALFAAWRFA